ncbi:MAG: hypothetical protein HFH14_09000, partial [Lachnospiraceae bacterium]|nr:hypothetical protein [Lachnospiraceae bacterium]
SDYADAAYSGGNYGSAGAESYGDSDNYSSEESSDYADTGYSGSNYGGIGAESYGDSYNKNTEKSLNYSDAGYGDNMLDKLPVPKPVSYYDDEPVNVVLKKSMDIENENDDNSFDKDKWQNRKNRTSKNVLDHSKKQ